MAGSIVGEIRGYPADEIVQRGTLVLDEIGSTALNGGTVELDLVAQSELVAAATVFIDPEAPLEPQTQVEFVRSTLGVLAPGAELPELTGRQWASLWPRAEGNQALRFVAAPVMDRMVDRQGFVERGRRYLPNDFTPHADLTALRAPDMGSVIEELLEDLSPEGRLRVEREGTLYAARYKSPFDDIELEAAYRRMLVAEGYRRDLVEAGRTIDEEAAAGVPVALFKSPLRSGPVDRTTYREDMLTAGSAVETANGTVIGMSLLDVQQNAPRQEVTMGDLFPQISPHASQEAHLVGEMIRQMAGKPDRNMTINGVNEYGWAFTGDGKLEGHPRYVGTVRFRTDDPLKDESRDYGHRIGSYARTWESRRNYMAARRAIAATVLPLSSRMVVR